MPLILNGTTGISGVDGSAGTPSYQGTDNNTGIFYPAADTIAFAEGGAEIARFDSSGNLGLGTSSPAYKLDVQGSVGATIASKTAEFNAAGGSIYTSFNDGTKTWRVGAGIWTAGQFSIRNQTDALQALDITASGNVGIGTSSPSTKFHVSGAGDITSRTQTTTAGVYYELDTPASPSDYKTYWGTTNGVRKWGIGNFGTGSDSVIAFYTNGTTERMRITSGGELCINTTGYNSGKVVRYDNVNDRVRSMIVVNDSTGSSSRCGYIVNAFGNSWAMEMGSSAANSNALNWTVDVFGSPTVRMVLTTAGAATNSTGTWGTISDVRLKENITDATPKLDNLMQLRVVNYNLKSDPDIKMLGFVAQEIEQVFPNMVEASGDLTEDGDRYKSVKTTVLIPMLVKAMQEQQAMIEELTNRIKKLEGV